MSTLNLGEKFDWTYCLSVDYRYEKERDRIINLLHPYGINFFDSRLFVESGFGNASFFIDGKGDQLPRDHYNQISPPPPPTWQDGPGAYAHFCAFKKMIGDTADAGTNTLLIVEDDLILTPEFEETATAALAQLPDDWDMFYFGANHTGHWTRDVDKNLLRCFGSACTHMVAFRHTIYDDVLALPPDRTIDWNIGHRLHQKYNCYACWPSVALQKPGYSLLWKQRVDYSDLWENKGQPA